MNKETMDMGHQCMVNGQVCHSNAIGGNGESREPCGVTVFITTRPDLNGVIPGLLCQESSPPPASGKKVLVEALFESTVRHSYPVTIGETAFYTVEEARQRIIADLQTRLGRAIQWRDKAERTVEKIRAQLLPDSLQQLRGWNGVFLIGRWRSVDSCYRDTAKRIVRMANQQQSGESVR